MEKEAGGVGSLDRESVTFYLIFLFSVEPLHFVSQLCFTSLSPEFFQFHGSNLICSLAPPLEISNLLTTSHTYTNENSDQKLRGWGYS